MTLVSYLVVTKTERNFPSFIEFCCTWCWISLCSASQASRFSPVHLLLHYFCNASFNIIPFHYSCSV